MLFLLTCFHTEFWVHSTCRNNLGQLESATVIIQSAFSCLLSKRPHFSWFLYTIHSQWIRIVYCRLFVTEFSSELVENVDMWQHAPVRKLRLMYSIFLGKQTNNINVTYYVCVLQIVANISDTFSQIQTSTYLETGNATDEITSSFSSSFRFFL